MAVNKVIFGAETLIDLTGDTVAPEVLLAGYTAHDASGEPLTGGVTVNIYYTGSSVPSSSFGNDGDLFLKV